MADIHNFPAPSARERKRRAPAAKKGRPSRQWTCNVCLVDTGVATSEIMQTTVAPRVKAGKVEGGTKRWICAPCNRRGKITIV